MTNLLDSIPAPLRSLWKAEIELRRGLWASVLKRSEPNPHYSEARRFFREALQARQATPEDEDRGKWGSAQHVAATVEQDRIDEATERVSDDGRAPRA